MGSLAQTRYRVRHLVRDWRLRAWDRGAVRQRSSRKPGRNWLRQKPRSNRTERHQPARVRGLLRQPALLSWRLPPAPEQPQLESQHPDRQQKTWPYQKILRSFLRQQSPLPSASDFGLNRWRRPEPTQSVDPQTDAQPD
jgi:hypothetical protein